MARRHEIRVGGKRNALNLSPSFWAIASWSFPPIELVRRKAHEAHTVYGRTDHWRFNDETRFQNGFGAMKKVTVLCKYDLANSHVADLQIFE